LPFKGMQTLANRVEKLIEAMTLEEKLGQLTMTASGYTVTGPIIAGDSTDSIRAGTLGNLLNMVGAEHCHEMHRLAVEGSRLGIPLLIGLDIIHGHRTLFPVPLAEAASFDPGAWTATAREAAIEAAADGLALTFAPMLDVSRDPRWGRGVEGPGEDSWLGTRIAEAKVRGFQGSDLSAANSLAACAKHFVAYGPVTAGREYAAVDISERTVHEVHLPPFAAAIKAGVATFMPSFTDLAGIPMTMHVGLLRGWLREKHGFDGVIISDYNAIGELIKHGVAADHIEAATLALKAGVDIDMMSDAYRRGLPIALERGSVTMEEIDAAVRRVLTLKERLGLFEDPYRRGVKAEAAEAIAKRRRLARDVGSRSLVLLKNESDTLPLGGVHTLALIGPLANAGPEMGGPWGAAQDFASHISVRVGLRNVLSRAEVLYEPGVDIQSNNTTGMAAAVKLCERADTVVLCVGEAANMSGEAASRALLDLPGHGNWENGSRLCCSRGVPWFFPGCSTRRTRCLRRGFREAKPEMRLPTCSREWCRPVRARLWRGRAPWDRSRFSSDSGPADAPSIPTITTPANISIFRMSPSSRSAMGSHTDALVSRIFA
jgi:beta-glucosidase